MAFTPAKTDGQARLKELVKEQMAKTWEAIKIDQDKCSHLAGCIGDKVPEGVSAYASKTDIIWHDDFGICAGCQKLFRPEDTAYEYWKQKKSLHKPSTSYHTVEVVPMDDDVKKEIDRQFCPLDGYPKTVEHVVPMAVIKRLAKIDSMFKDLQREINVFAEQLVAAAEKAE